MDWEKIKKSLKDGATMSIEKIEEYTKIGKLKIEELAAKRKIERNFVDMGERAFDLLEGGKSSTIADDLSVRKSIENISTIRAELSEIERKIREIMDASKNKAKDAEESDDSGI